MRDSLAHCLGLDWLGEAAASSRALAKETNIVTWSWGQHQTLGGRWRSQIQVLPQRLLAQRSVPHLGAQPNTLLQSYSNRFRAAPSSKTGSVRLRALSLSREPLRAELRVADHQLGVVELLQARSVTHLVPRVDAVTWSRG